MWRSVRARVLLWFVALAGLGLSLQAQESYGNVYGRVLDEQGGAVPGATATLTGPSAPKTTVSDGNGNFRFLDIQPGRYTVTVTMPGMGNVILENVTVNLGRNTQVTARLKVSGIEEKVTVSSAAPLLDPRKTETGLTFSQVELKELPTTRDIYAMMQQTPGVQLDTVNVAGNSSANVGGPNFTAKGSGQATYTVDGVTITDNSYAVFDGGQNGANPLYFDFDSFDEMQVSTGGSNVELQTPGASVNVVTKRGTNDIKGSARFFYASDKWQSNNAPEEAVSADNSTNQLRFVREYGAEIGGPIVRDRIWFWLAGARQDISQQFAFTDPGGNPVSGQVTLEPWNGKLNFQISDSNSANLFYTRSNRIDNKANIGGTRSPSAADSLNIITDLYKVEDSHVFSPSLFATANFAYIRADYDREPLAGLGVQALWENDSWNRSYRNLVTTNPQHQANVQGSKFFNTGTIGHELKFGFGYRHQLNDSASQFPGDQIFGSILSSSAYAAVTRGVDTRYEMDWVHGFVSDTITAGNLTVSPGVRYDYQRGKNIRSTAPANQTFPDLLPAVDWPGDPNYPIQFHDIEPRISATYALGKDRKTLLRASYSRFADQLGGEVVYQLNGLPVSSGIYYYWNDTNGDKIVQRDEVDLASGPQYYWNGINPFTLPNVPNAINRNYQAATTDEIVVGIDHELMPNFAVSASYTYRYFDHLHGHRPIGTSFPDTWAMAGTATGTAVADNGFVLNFNEPFYGVTLPDQPVGTEYMTRPGYYQKFNGAELQLTKRLSNRWMARASVAWQDWKQYLSTPESILDPNNDWTIGNPNENGGLAIGYGRETIWFNARWQFNLTGMYQLPWGINLAANFFGREGYPAAYNVRVRTRGQNDTQNATYRITIGKMEDFRLDNVYELDMRLEKAFQLGKINLTASADVFNVTNNDAVIQRQGLIGDYDPRPGRGFSRNDDFNRIVETQNPRVLRVGLRVGF